MNGQFATGAGFGVQRWPVSLTSVLTAAGLAGCLFTASLAGQAAATGNDKSDQFLFLTGRVVRGDSLPLERALQLDLFCGGRIQQQVYSADNGTFSFALEPRKVQGWMSAGAGNDGNFDRNSHWNSSVNAEGVFASSPFKTFNLSGCRIQLSANQGFSSNAINLANRSVFDNPDVGVIVLTRENSEEGQIVSATTLAAAPAARKDFAKVIEELSREKPNRPRALKSLTKLTAEHPGFAEAWLLRGELEMEQRQSDAARESFHRAIAADPAFPRPYLSMARLALFEEKWEEAATLTGKLLEMTPGSAQANYFNGLANFVLGRTEAAERSYLHLKTNGLGGQYPIALLQLGMIHMQRGQLADAAEELSLYLKFMPPAQMPPGQKEQLERQLATWKAQGVTAGREAENP